jgi:hypothetical protein
MLLAFQNLLNNPTALTVKSILLEERRPVTQSFGRSFSTQTTGPGKRFSPASPAQGVFQGDQIAQKRLY